MKTKYWLLILIASCVYTGSSLAKNNFEKPFNKGCNYFNNKEHMKAIPEFEKAIKLNPGCYQAHYNLGLIYEHKKDIEKAIEYYTKALEANAQYDRPHSNLANIYYNKKKSRSCKKALSKSNL